jgi:hypothetical protein
MANLTCQTGPAPHFKPIVKCKPFKGQRVEAHLEIEPEAHQEQQIKESGTHGDKGEKK